jgi:signal peptide peptidase SppA
MKQIPLRVLLACANEVWALDPRVLAQISTLLVMRAGGGYFSEEQIEARTAGGRQGQRGGAPDGKGASSIGIIPIVGLLSHRMGMMSDISGGTSAEAIAQDFRSMLADPSIKAIILDFDSPGGVSSGMEELAQEIFASRGVKPIIAQVNALCASAAYWIASAADEIVVTPSGQAGSIGTYTIHDDLSEAMAKAGVKETIIKAGKNKMIAPESQPLSEEAHGIIQARVNEAQAMFTRAVARGRNVSVSKVNDTFGQGLMFGAQELVNRGMADRVSSLAATCARFGADPHPVVTANTSAGRHFADMRASLDDMHKVLRTTR